MSGCIRFTVHHGPVPSEQPAGAGASTSIATLRPGQDIAGVFACTRKDRLMARSGTPYLALELRDAHRHDRRARVPRRRRARRAASSAATSCASPAASSASATSCSSRCGRSRAPRAPTPTRPASCPSPTATSTSSTASWSRWPARSTTPASARCWARCCPTASCAPSGGARRARATATTPTSAACWSTPSPSATLALEACQLHPRLDPNLLLTAALVHDLGKTREFTYGAEIGLTDAGRLLGHVELGLRLLDERGDGILDEPRRVALAHCVLTHHGPSSAPGGRFGSAEAIALFRLNAVDASIKAAIEHGIAPAASINP